MVRGRPLSARDATPADYPFFARLFPELAVPDPVPRLEAFIERMVPRLVIVCEDSEAIAYGFWQPYGRTRACSARRGRSESPRVRGAGRAVMEALLDSAPSRTGARVGF